MSDGAREAADREWLRTVLNVAWRHGYRYASGSQTPRALGRGDMIAIEHEAIGLHGSGPLRELAALRTRVAELEAERDDARKLRPLADWHDDVGPVLWWWLPLCEPPYVGSPLDDDFPDYVTHWTPIVAPGDATESEER